MIMAGLETLAAASFADDAHVHFNLLNFEAFKPELTASDGGGGGGDSAATSPRSAAGSSSHLVDDSLNTPISHLLDGPIFFGPSVILPPPVLTAGKLLVTSPLYVTHVPALFIAAESISRSTLLPSNFGTQL